MSIQFGKCNFDGKPVDSQDFDKVRSLLAPYGPDGESYVCKENFGVLYRAFHTTRESRLEVQPYVSESGFVLTWDGRLDNREELIDQIAGEISHESADLDIVAAAYQCWGNEAFSKLIGDWALSVWNPYDQSLILAKDFVGTRHLFYTVEKEKARWCTILDPLVLLAGHPFELEEEYIAGWLAFFPAPHLTPYLGVHSVPPSSFVRLSKRGQQTRKYWDFDPSKRIRYKADTEYEEHFRVVFAESVRRRLRSDGPVLAELSGGMDSSSIVCMADDLLAQGLAATSRLDTLSYYDSSENSWDERPYFSEVERKRGRQGCHIEIDSHGALSFESRGNRPVLTPNSFPNFIDQQFMQEIASKGYRVVLSGLGGDEVTGGVPTPIPELSDLLASGELRALACQLERWALEKRKPWFHLLAETLECFVPRNFLKTPSHRRPAAWLRPSFVARNRDALSGYDRRLELSGPLPSFQENIKTLNGLRRQMACSTAPSEGVYEARYPYLDRNLLEFLYAIPREQLVRPGYRRSLLRRALREIVPAAILGRRRKAIASRGPLLALASFCSDSKPVSLVGEATRIIDSQKLAGVLKQAQRGIEVPVVTIVRTILFESWIKLVLQNGILHGDFTEYQKDPFGRQKEART